MAEINVEKYTISIAGKLTGGDGIELIKAVEQWNEEPVKSDPITIYLSSVGGNVSAAFAIYDTLKLIEGREVICRVFSICHSAAIFILLGCTKRIGTRHSRFLIHPMSITKEHVKLTALDIEELSEEVTLSTTAAVNILIKETTIPQEKIHDSMWIRSSMYDSEEALKYGLLTEIIGERDDTI